MNLYTGPNWEEIALELQDQVEYLTEQLVELEETVRRLTQPPPDPPETPGEGPHGPSPFFAARVRV